MKNSSDLGLKALKFGVQYPIERIDQLPGHCWVVVWSEGDYDLYSVFFSIHENRPKRDEWMEGYVPRQNTGVLCSFYVPHASELPEAVEVVTRFRFRGDWNAQ